MPNKMCSFMDICLLGNYASLDGREFWGKLAEFSLQYPISHSISQLLRAFNTTSFEGD